MYLKNLPFTKTDFEYLKSQGIDIRNQIVIARYGAIFRGNIVLSLIIILKLAFGSFVHGKVTDLVFLSNRS